MCCIPQIMNETEPDGSTPFDPSLFFQIQRLMGLDPYVREQSIGRNVVCEPRTECLTCWANKSDPDGKKRAEYAAEKWNERAPGDVIVRLG